MVGSTLARNLDTELSAIERSICLIKGLENRSSTASPNFRLSSVSPMAGIISLKMHLRKRADTFSSFRHSPTVLSPYKWAPSTMEVWAPFRIRTFLFLYGSTLSVQTT